jgi:AcrR family transcriptional regulator
MSGSAVVSPATGGLRERRRAATVLEIKATARRLLVEQGTGSLSLRAVAREMGVTAPALYRYFDGHEALVEALAGDLYDELCDAMEAAAAAVPAAMADDRRLWTAARLVAATKTFRSWSVGHPAEFGLLFGAPIPGVDFYDENSPACVGGRRFGQVFAALFLELWTTRPFPVPDVADLDPRLLPQVERYRDELGVDLPVPVVYVFLSCWARLYGLVAMEVFGHLKFALDDAEPAFDTEVHQIGRTIGIDDLPMGALDFLADPPPATGRGPSAPGPART